MRISYWSSDVCSSDLIAGPVDNSLASMNVHGIVHRLTHAFGGVQFHDGRYHRGFVAELKARTGIASGSLDQVGIARPAPKFFLHPPELAYGYAKLRTHARLRARPSIGTEPLRAR